MLPARFRFASGVGARQTESEITHCNRDTCIWIYCMLICFVMGGMLLHTINKTHTPVLKLHVD